MILPRNYLDDLMIAMYFGGVLLAIGSAVSMILWAWR